MQIVAIIAIVASCIFAIYEMYDSNKSIREEWYKSLDRDKKISAISLLKKFWKINIILIAVMIGVLLIIISTFFGKKVSYDFILSIIASIFSITSIVFIIFKRKKYDKRINEFK